MTGLFAALSKLLERLEAGDASGAEQVLAEVQSQLVQVSAPGDLLELRLLNARCQEAAKRLAAGLESKIHDAAVSNRAVAAYGHY